MYIRVEQISKYIVDNESQVFYVVKEVITNHSRNNRMTCGAGLKSEISVSIHVFLIYTDT